MAPDCMMQNKDIHKHLYFQQAIMQDSRCWPQKQSS